jgi:hypothetical protein
LTPAWWTVWREPRATVQQVSRGDAAGFVILVAFLVGVLDVLQTSAMRASMKPHWGPFALLMAIGMGPLLGFAYFEVAGSVAGSMGRLLGGVADVSDTRVALACGTLPELVALPFWGPVLAAYGLEIFTTEQPPRPIGLLVFGGLQLLLSLWAWGLRVACLAEVHDFSILRAAFTVLLSWLAGVVLVVGVVLAVAGMVGK